MSKGSQQESTVETPKPLVTRIHTCLTIPYPCRVVGSTCEKTRRVPCFCCQGMLVSQQLCAQNRLQLGHRNVYGESMATFQMLHKFRLPILSTLEIVSRVQLWLVHFKRTRIQLTSIHHTAPVCPLKEPRRSPFSEYHTLGCGSLALENSKSPSLLYLICVMDRSCP